MKFKATSIKQAIVDIEHGQIFLPPIQRDFVWQRDRIESLFDSLFRNYPIGICIFWKLQPETAKSYPLYEFIREYSENKSRVTTNKKASNNLLEGDVYAVVDGQQRLSSFLIGLAGTYRYKKSGKGRQNVDANFVASRLYANLMFVGGKAEEDGVFKFLGDQDASVLTDKELWFEVGNVLSWKNISEATAVLDDVIQPKVYASGKKGLISKYETRKEKIHSALMGFYTMLHEKNLHYFDIDNQNLDDVVDIFTRVNSGAMVLKSSDLLFSILVGQWNEGREEIKELVEAMRESGVGITQDFIMRACLVLSDLPVKYKLESFTARNIKKIKDNWNAIKGCLRELCNLLPQLGYVDYSNLSDNALIPIAYYIKNGGDIKKNASKISLQKYYVTSQVTSAFSGQSDQVLEKIRSEIKSQLTKKNVSLDYGRLVNISLPGRKSLRVTEDVVEDLVENTSYGSSHAYFLLSMLYPTVDFKARKYEVDHIHPRSKFNRANLIRIGIDNEELISEWMEQKRDLLPNLELLGRDNQSKGSATLSEYLAAMRKAERATFLKENLLPTKPEEWELKDFDRFFEVRKRKLVTKLKKKFE